MQLNHESGTMPERPQRSSLTSAQAEALRIEFLEKVNSDPSFESSQEGAAIAAELRAYFADQPYTQVEPSDLESAGPRTR